MPRVRLAIVGCGIAARKIHLPALQDLPKLFEIVVACSRTEESARSFAKLAGGVDWTTDWRDVLRRGDVDAVDLILPVEMNLPVTRAAIAAGKHVIVEKPLATTMAECRAMVRTADSTKLAVMVAENMRYRPALRKLRALIEGGKLGRVYASQWLASTDLAPETSPYARTQWRIDHKFPGGFPMDAGVHYANAIRMLFGEVVRVSSWATSANPAIGEVDTHFMEYDTKAGVHGVYCHCFSAKGHRDDRLVVLGTEATAVLEGKRLTLRRRGRKDRVEEISDDWGYRGQFRAFHAAATRGVPTETPCSEALRDFAVIEASLRSAKKGAAVKPKPG